MSHLSDNELDRLSREAAEQFDVEGSTSGWDALEKNLDKSMPADAPIKKRRGLWYWLSGFLLLIGILAYYNFYSDNKQLTKDQTQVELHEQKSSGSVVLSEQKSSGSNTLNDLKSSNARNKESNANGKAGKSGIEELNSEGVKNNSETVSGGRVQNSEGTFKTISGNGVQQSKGTSEIISGKGVQQSKGTSETISGARQNKLSSISAKNQNNKNKPSPFEKSNPGSSISLQDKNNNQVVVEKNIQENQPINEIPEVDFIKQTSLPIIQHQHSPIDIYVSTHADSMIAKLANVAIPERDTSVKSNTIFPFEVGMLVGSDMSNVNFQGNERMGLNFGIYVGYRINKRWLINTGLIHDKKYYSARGKDFHPPKGYWTDYVKLDLVAGNCSMWEIPLNVRYDLSLTRKGSWFLSGGLSTYLMQQEDYDYHYWTNGNFYTRHKGYPSSEKNILSIINLSGGFEKNFTPHVSLQIEPYMRIPLKGIGFGNMQMNSFGTNFILKFKSGPAKK